MGVGDIAGRRVMLREFVADDFEAMHGIVGDERVTRWMAIDAFSRAETGTWFDQILQRGRQKPRTEFFLAVEAAAQVVGFARLTLAGVKAADVGFAIGAEHWGKKYATDAATTIVGYGFETLGLHRISAAVGPENRASATVLTRLGFIPEGRIRDHVYTNDAWRDSIAYGLLAPEWTPR